MTLPGTSESRTASVLRRQRHRPPCPCGECSVEIGFCDQHRERLGRFRDSFDAASKAKGRDGLRAKSPGRSTCCALGCWEPRLASEKFCDRHAADGYADGIGE
jgi:hypothetical protein